MLKLQILFLYMYLTQLYEVVIHMVFSAPPQNTNTTALSDHQYLIMGLSPDFMFKESKTIIFVTLEYIKTLAQTYDFLIIFWVNTATWLSP